MKEFEKKRGGRMKERKRELEKDRTEKEEEESGTRGGNVPFINTRAA
jgi:hypothetical protein